MVKVAECESKFRQFNKDGTVLQGEVNPKDKGVFQINIKYHLADSKKAGLDIYTLEGNLKYAQILYKRNGTRDWNASKECWSE